MDKRISSKIPYVLIVVLGLAIAGLLLYILPYRYNLNRTVAYEESNELLENPLIGFAAPAENEEEGEKNNLVYIGLTWAEWEPKQDTYDIEALEEKFHIEKWKKENKHAVLRFICDIPGEEKHKDIPDWLYQKTKDGSYYEMAYGAGYSPDYSNRFFQERHAKAIKVLAEYCNKDEFVAYVELGSLGHWGEWHTNTDEGVQDLPDADTCWQYVLDYSDNFHNVQLLMRRNYVMVSDGGLGLYNDMTGHKEDTEEWLDWINNGGSYETSGEELEYVPIENFWETGPVGGEMTSEYSMEELLDDRFQETLSLIQKTHMTFIGPNCPQGEERESSAALSLLDRLGYRFYISELRTQFSFADNQLDVFLTWENAGLAPIYWDWPVTMYVYNKSGELKYWESIDFSLSELMPGEELVTESHIPFTDLFRQGFQIGIGITSPNEKEHIQLAMDVEKTGNVQIIYTYDE